MTYAERLKQRLYNAQGTEQPVRAVVYARVSTDNDGQKDSCANQVESAENWAQNHPNIRIIATYVDDGISGKNDDNRPQYQAMMEQVRHDQVDLIVTKALSRLNRSEMNSLKCEAALIEHEATVFTLEDGQLHDFEDLNAGILHSLSFAIDAQYVKRQSLSGRKVQALRCERKELSSKDTAYGYHWNKEAKTIVIEPSKAETVRYIFEEYVYRDRGTAEIQRSLAQSGVRLSQATIGHILQDERYIGRFYINKRTTKLGTGSQHSKRIALPKASWVLVAKPDLRIVSDSLFELAQKIRTLRAQRYVEAGRSGRQSYFQGRHTYSGKIFCEDCGKPYHHDYADRKQTVPIYRITHNAGCKNDQTRIYEEDLNRIVREALRKTIGSQDKICTMLENTLAQCVRASESGTDQSLTQMKKDRAAKEKQMEALIDSLADGLTGSAKQRLVERINALDAQIEDIGKRIAEKESAKPDAASISEAIQKIHDGIQELREFKTLDRGRIQTYVDKILIGKGGCVKIYLMSGHRIIDTSHTNSKSSVGKTFSRRAPY